jgi:hypothetical protein
MSAAFSIILSFALSACIAALLKRMSPFRRSKLGVPFQSFPPMPGGEQPEPRVKAFIQLDSGSDNVVDAANRWRSKWHRNSIYLER